MIRAIHHFLLHGLMLSLSLVLVSDLYGQAAQDTLQNTPEGILLARADSVMEKGQIQEAIALVKQAQVIFIEQQSWEPYVKAWLSIARYLDGHPENERRMNAINQAIQNGNKYLPPDHQLLAAALQQKGELYIFLSHLDSARVVLTEAIRIGEKAEAWEDLSWALVIASIVDYYESDLTNMDQRLDRALQIAETQIAEPYEHFGTINQLQAILFDATGDYVKAFTASQKTLTWLEEKPNATRPDSVVLANAYNTHGAICHERGDYDLAIHYYKIALSIHQQTESEVSTLIAINNNISIAYKRKTHWELARYYIESSKALLPEKPANNNYKDWIQTYQILAAIQIDQKENEEAIVLLEKTLPYSEQYDYHQEWIQTSYGNVLLELQETEKAKTQFRNALAIFQKDLGYRHPDVAELNGALGDAFVQQDSLDKALFYFQKTLLALSLDFSDTLAYGNPELENINALTKLLPTLNSKAKVLRKLSQKDRKWEVPALDTYRMAIAAIDRMRENHETEEAKLLLSTNAKEIYEGSIQLLHQLYQQDKNIDFLAEAFQLAEKSKSLLLLEMIRDSETRQKQAQSLYAGDTLFYHLLDEGKSIKNEVLFFEKKLAAAQSKKLEIDHPKIRNAEDALAKLYMDQNIWKTAIKQQYPAYYELQYHPHFATLETIQRNIVKEQSTFLEYFVGEESAFLFLLKAHDVQFLQIAEPTKLEAAVADFQDLLLKPSAMKTDAELAYANYNRTAFHLYEMALQNTLADLPEEHKHLIIVPDGILTSIPFEALNQNRVAGASMNFAKLPYLLKEYQIHYGYSANLLLANQHRQNIINPNVECLALAPPYADLETDSAMRGLRASEAPLKGTVGEIKAISTYFSGEFDYSASATEAHFKKEAANFGLLHLAMHGLPDFENPDFAHLKFTNLGRDTTEDNLLHHYEIVNMEFNAQLAVLSACETGVGRYEKGEGVFSLARSFMFAGVPSVVMSLWKISDRSTSQLMPFFYKNLANGMGKETALQMAKKDFIEAADLEFRHPYYWSGMILLGDQQALKKPAPFFNWYWLAGCIFLSLGAYFLGKRFL